jgi:hypothetical protein
MRLAGFYLDGYSGPLFSLRHRNMDIVVTTVFLPTRGMKCIAQELAQRGGRLWVIGDRKGPPSYDLPGVRFFDLASQIRLTFQLAQRVPEKHYSRKNLGYLLAMQENPTFIAETDDDNIPLPSYWQPRAARITAKRIEHQGWWNVYREYSLERIWPRGFPLEEINPFWVTPATAHTDLVEQTCFIQQGLADGNPDVDAVYRLTCPLPVHFNEGPPTALAKGCWCPFNSQNAVFFRPAYPLMYLPTYCNFRMTDIWRSLVAQRCLWEMDSQLCFTSATVCQERNEHDLLKDFEDELPGYLHNNRLRGILENTSLRPGTDPRIVGENLACCYESLVRAALVPEKELSLLSAWISDLPLESLKSGF